MVNAYQNIAIVYYFIGIATAYLLGYKNPFTKVHKSYVIVVFLAMNRFIFIVLIQIVSFVRIIEGRKIPCTGLHVNGKIHEKQILATGLNRPYQLSMYKPKNAIFFSYNDGKDEEDTFKIAYITLNHTQHKLVEKIKNGFSTAVDENNHDVYFGGSDGIYVQNLHKENGTIKHIIPGHNIWDMFFKDHLYFIDYPRQRLYKCETKNYKCVEEEKYNNEKIFQFVIDGDGDEFMATEKGFVMIEKNTNKSHIYSAESLFRAIGINNKGVAYFCGKHGIYVANKKQRKLQEIVKINNLFGITFDKDDNIIYSDPHEIIRLLPENC